MAVQQQHGPDALREFYTQIGTRRHNEGREFEPAMYVEALEAAGLPAELADAATDESLDDAVRASHNDGIDRVGQEVGTPVIAIGETAFFGPVLSPAPKGEAAGRVFDGARLRDDLPDDLRGVHHLAGGHYALTGRLVAARSSG